MDRENFTYKVVFFKQPGCVACGAMDPIWSEVAADISESYPHYNIGFGTWDVTSDNWEFCDAVGCDGTPNFIVIDDANNLIGLNTEGIMPGTQLKDFIINCIENR